MIWADFSYESVFGFKPQEPVYTAPQRLTLDDPRVVQRYNKILLQEHTRQHLRQRAFSIQSAVPSGLQITHRQEYEKLALLDNCARKHAKKKCGKLMLGAVPFSDSIKKARDAIDLWELVERHHSGVTANKKKIRRLMHHKMK